MLNDYGKYMNLDRHSVRDEFKNLFMNNILFKDNCKYSLKNILKTYRKEAVTLIKIEYNAPFHLYRVVTAWTGKSQTPQPSLKRS